MASYIGIDVGKYQLDMYDGSQYLQFENTPVGLKKLIKYISTLSNHPMYVFEATGGYERPLKDMLIMHDYAYHMAHPNKIRAFAKAQGLLAKTDRLDAKLIAEYASFAKPNPDQVKGNIQIKALLKRREQLITDKLKESNRLDKHYSSMIIKSMKQHIKWLDKAIQTIDTELQQYHDKHIDLLIFYSRHWSFDRLLSPCFPT